MILYLYHKKEAEVMYCSHFEELNVETFKDVYGGRYTWSGLGKPAGYGATCRW